MCIGNDSSELLGGCFSDVGATDDNYIFKSGSHGVTKLAVLIELKVNQILALEVYFVASLYMYVSRSSHYPSRFVEPIRCRPGRHYLI